MPPPLPDWRSFAGDVIAGDYLVENPYIGRAVIDPLRREQQLTLAGERQRLNQMAGAAGRFGGDVWGTQQARAFEASDRNLGNMIAQALFTNYGAERGHQQGTMNTLAGFEQAQKALEAQERQAAAARASAAAARAAELAFGREQLAQQFDLGLLGLSTEDAWRRHQLGQNLDFARQQLALEGVLGAGELGLGEMGILAQLAGMGTEADLAGLQLMSQLGLGYGGQQLDALSMVPALEGAGYIGPQTAFGMQQTIGQGMDAAARQRYQNQRLQWEYGRNAEQEAFGDYLATLLGLASVGGTQDTRGMAAPNTQVPYGPSPALAGVTQGLAGALAGLGTFGTAGFGSLFGGGGGGGDQMTVYVDPRTGSTVR